MQSSNISELKHLAIAALIKIVTYKKILHIIIPIAIIGYIVMDFFFDPEQIGEELGGAPIYEFIWQETLWSWSFIGLLIGGYYVRKSIESEGNIWSFVYNSYILNQSKSTLVASITTLVVTIVTLIFVGLVVAWGVNHADFVLDLLKMFLFTIIGIIVILFGLGILSMIFDK